MKKIALAVALSMLGAGTSVAADMAVKARPAPIPVPVYSWTGCYIGVNGGGIWSDTAPSPRDMRPQREPGKQRCS